MKNEGNSGSSEIEYARYNRAAPAFRAALLWIESVLHIDIPSDKCLRSFLASGEILCSLLNTLVPGAIKRINHCPNRASAMDNLSLFISACQEKCGIPRSKLFSIDDFDDILDRGFECQSNGEFGVKQSEKVVISLFWLAKFVDHDPRCEDLPKLDYSAFTGLLPKTTIIQSLPSFSTGDQISSEYGAAKTQIPVSRNSTSVGSVVNKKSTVERLPEAHQFVRPPSAMGNTDSSRVVIPPNSKDNSVVEPLSVEQTTVEETQTNNNGTEEDEWQADLDDWRQRRRRVSRQQATKMMSFEEIQEEEERKRREAIRDRMRRIKTQRSCISNSFIASTDIVRPTPPNSPGMALLTGGGFNLLEDIDEVSLSPAPTVPESTPVPESSLAVDQSNNKSVTAIHQNGLESKPLISQPACDDHKSSMNGFKEHSCVESNQIVPTKQEDSIEDTAGSQSPAPKNDRFSTADYREVQIRLQSKVKTVESRWGMMIRADGPSETAPFVIERVRIGSTADVCDVMNGDILLELNSTDLSPRSGQPLDAVTLQELESLMDQLSFTGRPATLRVLRKPNQIEEFSDTEQGKETPIASNSAGSVTTDTSDIDDRTEFKPTQDTAVTRIQDQSASKSNNVLSHPDESVLHLPPSYSDQPRSPRSQQRLHDVPYPNSSDLAESTDSGRLKAPLRPPTDFPLKKSLSAQIVDTSEVGASCLHSSSQIEDSSTSRTVSARVHRPVEISRAEPTHLSLSSISTLDARLEHVLLVQQPNVESPQVIQGSSSSVDHSIDLGSTPNTAWSETPNSPLPPPPALSPLITSPISSPTTIQPTTDSRIVRQTFPELPSPPSPMFFNNDELSRPHISDTISQRPSSKVTPSPLRFETSFTSLNPPPRVSDDHMSRASDDPQFGNRLQSDSNIYRVCPKLQSESRDATASSVPPAPPSPLLTPSRSTLYHPIAPLSSPQSSDIDEIDVDDCTQNRSVKISQHPYSSRRKFYPPPPPLPIPKQDAPPPPPPRVPLNKGINPRNKCTACTRELGTGDLMIISSMSLYYHLACFVCSRCGEPLSDGLSNADVRIRTGQLYCQTCYPSKRKTAAQGDSSQHKSDRAGTLPARSSTPVACADRRNRSRAPTYQVASGESGTKHGYM